MRILIVESIERNQALIKKILQPLSLEIDAVYSMQDGTHYIASGIYDIIIYGWTIPTTNWIDEESKTVAIVSSKIPHSVSQIALEDVHQELRQWVESKIHLQATVVIGDLTLDQSTRRLMTKTNSVMLTPNEVQLFILLTNSPEPVAKKVIEKILFKDSVSSNQVEVYISYLRQKLKQLNTTVRILTIRNVGYLIKTS